MVVVVATEVHTGEVIIEVVMRATGVEEAAAFLRTMIRAIPVQPDIPTVSAWMNRIRSRIERSPVKSKDEASSTEEDWEADEKAEAIKEEKDTKPKSPKEDTEGLDGEGEDGGEDTEKEEDAASDTAPSKPFINLVCVHCKEKSSSFGAQLLRMRVAQRGAQRELEAAAGTELAMRTTFCLVCRLNHRTTRHAHNLTDTHRAMKRFLMPFCRACRLTFRSPMIYEHHICSIEHLKRKAIQGSRRASPKQDPSGDEGMDVDLDNFMTLDSVGDVDEVEDDDSGGEKKDSEDKPKKSKVEINIGNDEKESNAEETPDLKVKAEKTEATADKKTVENGTDAVNVSGNEDKLWADVDKDIGELLREVDPQGNEAASDDEEDLGRYDKFRKSDKASKPGEEEEGKTKEESVEGEKTSTETINPSA
ncbi:unnamed protein product [Leptidea sinapis]|uniref:Uncharacterized protein n=1 Tax=Leptidea sinapis TaxID=189913 RepID=A0A5E4PQX2_9NEOP|nr:unnamed protein product [Leptidea sinapis]